jgi:hypothetical protein
MTDGILNNYCKKFIVKTFIQFFAIEFFVLSPFAVAKFRHLKHCLGGPGIQR